MLNRLTVLVFLLFLAACSPFATEQRESPQLPASYQTAAPETQTASPLAQRWWQAFADPQLNNLQQQLLSGNLDLRQAIYRLEQLEALQRISGASLWPALNLNANASRDRASSGHIGNSSRISLAAGYEVDLWNRLHDQEKAAELRQQAGTKEVQTLLLSLTAQLSEQYFLALEQRTQVQLVEQQIERTRQLLTTATERYRAGLATSEEIYLARQNLTAQEARLPQLRSTLNQAEQGIALLLGRFADSELTKSGTLPQLTSIMAVGLPADLLTQRPDVAAAALQLEAVDHELAAALSARLPAINLTASLGRTTSQIASGDIEGGIWSLALALTQPLFDAGRRQAEADRQQAQQKEQLAAYRQTLLSAVKDVETALVADQNNAERLAQLTQQQQISQQRLDLALANYRSGLDNSSALLTSEINHLNSRSQTITAQRQWLSSRISLARALGGSWMTEELSNQRQPLKETEKK